MPQSTLRRPPLTSHLAASSVTLLSLVLVSASCGPPVSEAQTADSWVILETEGEPTARHENAFVELDGNFYLIGGRGDRPVDVYDPETNRWTQGAAAPMEIHHMQAVAFDGRIYVVGAWTGGFPDEQGIENVLIYDPGEDAWSVGPEIPEDRRRGAAGAVAYGDHIYVVAGNDGGHGPHATAVDWFDRLDPRTGSWGELPPAPRGRDHFHAAIAGNRLYVAGGRDSGVEGFIDSTFAEVDVYDFDASSWTTLTDAPLPTERAGSTTAVVGHRVVITGGEGFGQAWGETEVLDTETGTWTSWGTLNQPRHGTQAIVYDDKIWIAAGAGDQGGGPELTSLEVFDFGDMR